MDFEKVIDPLLQQGVLGVLLLAAGYVIYRLSIRYDALQEKRVQEGVANYKIISELTEAVRELARTHPAKRPGRQD